MFLYSAIHADINRRFDSGAQTRRRKQSRTESKNKMILRETLEHNTVNHKIVPRNLQGSLRV